MGWSIGCIMLSLLSGKLMEMREGSFWNLSPKRLKEMVNVELEGVSKRLRECVNLCLESDQHERPGAHELISLFSKLDDIGIIDETIYRNANKNSSNKISPLEKAVKVALTAWMIAVRASKQAQDSLSFLISKNTRIAGELAIKVTKASLHRSEGLLRFVASGITSTTTSFIITAISIS